LGAANGTPLYYNHISVLLGPVLRKLRPAATSVALGLYEFSEAIDNVNVDNIVDKLSKILRDTLDSLSNVAETESELEAA